MPRKSKQRTKLGTFLHAGRKYTKGRPRRKVKSANGKRKKKRSTGARGVSMYTSKSPKTRRIAKGY